MKILFDQGTPVPLRRFLGAHEVSTAFEMKWTALQNGELLRVAEAAGFECFVTTDQNLKYQQNLAGRKLAVAVILTTSWLRIEPAAAAVAAQIAALRPGGYVEIKI